ncbi:unnamed protein product [Brachionus calyciflorus]|uniref:Uncharacterized protein n=1 Tax=Brachionus calyciflorus TaxID=104777 RepID=A0A813ZLS7_9BILA|nr:unnamed protein product [Brachionus calyciflorus]
MAETFTSIQIREFQEIFDLFDTDNSGYLDKTELIGALNKLGIKCEEDNFNEIYSKIDKDSSEFLEIMAQEFFKKMSEKQARECFKRFDINGDGFITINEFRIVLEKLGKQMTQKQLEDMIQNVKNDYNGITFEVKSESEFKCITDGLFEDENDCEGYYECMWIGTAFEKQVHNKCFEGLIYNPKKHRCDNLYEFENQFSKGIQTGEDLLDFMRYRNCIESKNILTESTKIPNITLNNSLYESNYSNMSKKEVKDLDTEFSNSSSFITVEILSNNFNETENETFNSTSTINSDNNTSKSDHGKLSKFFGTFSKNIENSKFFKVNIKKTFLDMTLDKLSQKLNITNSTELANDSYPTYVTHRRRRLLSLDNLYETTAYDETTDDDLTSTTLLLEDEIDSTDEVFLDKDDIVHQFSKKVINKLKQDENNTLELNKKTIIDSIEESLSKKSNNITKEFLTNKTVSLKTDIYQDANFSVPITTKIMNTNENVKNKSNTTSYNPFKRPLKFLKMLPRLNFNSSENRPKTTDMLGEILNITSKLINEINSTKISKTISLGHNLEYEEGEIEGVKSHKIKKMTTKTTKKTMETHYTTFFPHKPETTTRLPLNMTTYISSDKTKPTMQTYKINPNKKLPNQFASLRLNYDQDSLITKIDEIEKGGKFQRLRLVPADTLIECKENDFGLECSCSITLSPPKCKQLINSFLSSCRILGCKNNGKCINMAFKYPIPYVCSCPSDFMGSYCEMARNTQVENDLSENNSSRSTTDKSINLKNITVVTEKMTTTSTTSYVTTSLKLETFTEPLCNPNPCMNNAKCLINQNSFVCLCSNASYTGRYCENYRSLSTLETTLTATKKTIPKTEEITTKFTTTAPRTDTSTRRTYHTTPRAYIWQCPSNCFYNFGRGYCTLSSNGNPHCVCRLEWTGVDCSQKNYCLTNKCEHNSTCSNYPEMRSYLCVCPQGYTGRFCEIPTMAPMVSQLLPVAIAQKLMSGIEIKNQTESKELKNKFPIKNQCEDEKIKCLNNGSCLMSFSHAKNKFGFVCICKESFTGQFCEIEIKKEITTTPTSTTTTTTRTSTTTTTTTATITTTTTTTSTTVPPKTTTKTEKSIPKILKNEVNYENPCKLDPDICRKNPLGNDSYTCVKSFLTQDYTLCLNTKTLNCKESNPCLNGGHCIHDDESDNEDKPSWRCECTSGFTGRLCETEICTGVHKLFNNHTMCRPDSPNLTYGGLNSSDIETILNMHNNLRRNVSPSAANMQQIYWDVRLQHLAQKRAQLCSVENTGILMRQQPGYGVVIGENLAAGYEKWAHVMSSWMGEKNNFIYKSTSSTDNLQSGHYTQMIYSSAARIGCGFSHCSNSSYERYFVCYYGEMQTYQSRYEPYQEGKTCSGCEKNCNNGLCDCKGAYCLNGGTMDLNTCTCTCPYSTFSGKYCENVVCPKEDSPFCAQAMFEDKCWLYPVVRATCPYMCSLCTKNTARISFVNSTLIPTQTQKLLFKNEGSYFN